MTRTRTIARCALAGLALLALLVPLSSSAAPRKARSSKRAIKADLRFAAEMAEQGLWREALFRWERVLEARPGDARILNNIAVAREALGDREGAREAYDQAMAAGADPKINANRMLFIRAEERIRERTPEELVEEAERERP